MLEPELEVDFLALWAERLGLDEAWQADDDRRERDGFKEEIELCKS